MSDLVSRYAAMIKAPEKKDARIYEGQINTYEEWDGVLENLWSDSLITRNQWRALRSAAHKLLPAMFSVTQRNPKQTTYFIARGKGEIKCNNRAKIELNFNAAIIT